ncbi:MAG TPA: hypothetical protein ENK29_00200 [Chromatiales bacterium]|nr:hypothetical protein [Chromatiales bacterium]
MRTARDGASRGHQTGMATLAVVVLLLSLITIAALTAARNGVTEQRISANLYRERQAFAAAQAGLAVAWNTLTWRRMNGLAPGGTLSGGTGTLGNDAVYHYAYRLVGTTPAPLVEIMSSGRAGDGTGKRTLWQMAQFIPPLAIQPDGPLTSRKAVYLNGAVLNNLPGGPLIRAGGPITYTPGRTGSACRLPGQCMTDPDMNGLTEDEFFATYFNMNRDMMTQLATGYDCDVCTATADGQTGAILYIENRRGTSIHLENSTLGSVDDPVILLVGSDIRGITGVSLYGLLYVMGGIEGIADDVAITGALVSDQDIVIQGDIAITHDTGVLGGLDKLGHFAMLPGSWRDF